MFISYRILGRFKEAMYAMDPPNGGDESLIYDEVEKVFDDVLTMIKKELDEIE